MNIYEKEKMAKFKKDILDSVRFLMASNFGLTNKKIDEMFEKSNIEYYIEAKPDVYGHMTPEQIMDLVLL